MGLNSTEAKYMAPNSASCEALWLHKLIAKSTDQMSRPTVVYGVIKVASGNMRIQYFLIASSTLISVLFPQRESSEGSTSSY